MRLTVRRAIAASIPAVVLASTTLAVGAAPVVQHVYRSFGFRPFVTNASVLGGGATLPIPAYLGHTESSGTTSSGSAGSIFGYFATQSGGLNVQYCATGSGAGKTVFEGPTSTVNKLCSNAPSGANFGFSGGSGSPAQPFPSLTGSDAPLTQTDYSNYTSDHTSPQEPVELPSIFGAIAIYYHDNALGSSGKRIALNDSQVCAIYNKNSGIKTFGQLLGNGDTTPIVPVYRSDGSGTSFNFSNHLATVCSGYNGNQTFTLADPNLPANALGVKGNSAIVSTVASTNGAIGYVEAGYLTNAPTGTGTVNYADIYNTRSKTVVDPFQGLPAAANSVSATLSANVAVVQGTGPATLAPLMGVRYGSCVQVVAPANYANPSTGYPIIAVTYLLFNSNGNNSNGNTSATALRLLEKDLTTQTLFKHPGATTPITTVDEAEPAVTSGTTGYSSLGAGFNSVVQNTANSCINV